MGKCQSKDKQDLSPAEFDQLVRSSGFSKEEVQYLHDKFKKEFPNGFCDREGMKRIYASEFPKGTRADTFIDHIFRVYDVDNNNKVSFQEFVVTLHIGTRGTVEEKLTAFFRLYDVDGSKFITEKELRDILQAIYKSRNDPHAVSKAIQEAAGIMSQLDADKNKKLSETEFIKAAKGCPECLKIIQGQD